MVGPVREHVEQFPAIEQRFPSFREQFKSKNLSGQMGMYLPFKGFPSLCVLTVQVTPCSHVNFAVQ